MLAILISCFCLLFITSSADEDKLEQFVQAKCVISEKSGVPIEPVRGVIRFIQKSLGGPTTIKISLSGFRLSDYNREHAIHIHESGDTSDECMKTGEHYNPNGYKHGGRNDKERHVGDLGNIEEDAFGNVRITLIDHQVSLIGSDSVISRSVVIHQHADDMGKGWKPSSQVDGNAGSRLACCRIDAVWT